MIWLTSDYHFFHNNILRLCNRPFKDVYEMHDEIIKRHNEVVGVDDTVYNLGDVTFGKKHNVHKTEELLNKMNGKMILIKGNHDHGIETSNRFDKVYDYLELREEKLVLSHYPFMSWNGMFRGSICIHGHCHGQLRTPYNELGVPYKAKRMDVGVDSHNFYPINLEQVHTILDNVKYIPLENFEQNNKGE